MIGARTPEPRSRSMHPSLLSTVGLPLTLDSGGIRADSLNLKYPTSMWHPRDAFRHLLPPARWPTADEAARSRWFAALNVGRLHLAERTWVPAMVPWRATEDGFATPDVLDWYERFARGCPGAIVVEATGVRDIPSGPLLRIGHDRFIPGLAELVRRVKHASGGRTRLFIQLIDFLTVKRR